MTWQVVDPAGYVVFTGTWVECTKWIDYADRGKYFTLKS